MHPLMIFAAADTGSSGSAGAALVQLAIFLLIPVAMYFFLIRPQRRRQREQMAMQASIGVGDEIMTTSGVYGFITGFDGDIVWLEIDDNVQIRIARAAVQRRVDTAVGEVGGAPSHQPDAASAKQPSSEPSSGSADGSGD